MPKNETDLSMIINNRTYNDYYDRLKMIASSLFTWENLDDLAGYGASNFLELTLYENGKACIVKDPEFGFLALRVNPNSSLNVYNLPIRIEASSTGYNKSFNFDEIIYVKNNILEKPTSATIDLFAYRLYECERTIDVNLLAQKTPVLIEGDNKSVLTLKNLYMQYSGNVPFIFGNKNFDMQNRLSVLKTDAPYIIDKLEMYKHEIINDCLTFLGINNTNTDKKERLIVDEANANNQLINYCLYNFMKPRIESANLFNQKFFNGEEKIKVSLNKTILDEFDIDFNFEEAEEGVVNE